MNVLETIPAVQLTGHARAAVELSQPTEALATMDDFVKNMHTNSGLLQQIEASTTTLEQAADKTMAFLQEHIPEARTVPLCGNSIGTDRRFLVRWMPEIEEFLHYRSVDVSTIKELGKRWHPDAMGDAPRKALGHRALDDIRESIEELKYYRAKLFREATTTSTPEAGTVAS